MKAFHRYLLTTPSGRSPFGPSTVPASAGIFPTDFSSTMTAADCLVAIADVAANPLRAVALFVSPTEVGLVRRSRRPPHAEALISRCASFPALFSQSHRPSRGTPCCFRYVTVESTGLGCCPSTRFRLPGTDNWGCHVCCLLTPHPSTPILTDGLSVCPVYTVRSAHIFALCFLQPAFTERISASRYPSCYLSRGWTCSLTLHKLRSMLDAESEFGTLAELHQQAAGLARHTTRRSRRRLTARLNSHQR